MASSADRVQQAVAARTHSAISTGCVELDGMHAWLAMPTTAYQASLPRVSMLTDKCGPAFEGVPDEYVKANAGIEEQMRNRVRKCASCGKPNAYTLPVCNSCGGDLTKVDITFTPNIFMSFVYGIQKGPFPYTISIRSQTEQMMVFDDLLALTPAHLNVIPTDTYLPDFRSLFVKPEAGRKLLDSMFDSCFAVLKEQFLSDAKFRALIKDVDSLSDDDLKAAIGSGLNYPPSQYQLHLQFMCPPFLPFQWKQCLLGVHMTHERFFPLEYVRAALDKLIESNSTYSCDSDTPVSDTIAHFKKLGVDYDAIHSTMTNRVYDAHRKLANFSATDFEAVVVGEDVVVGDQVAADKKAMDLVNQDKNIFQNYGRPYDASGRFTGTYYKFAKKPSDVRSGL